MEIKPKKKETIKSIDKALNLLEFLHRILNTLKYRGYILQNQKTAKYRLGMKLFELGCEVRGTKNLIKTIRPYLRKLSKITNETANLAILEDKEVIYLDTIESSETLRTEIIQGSRTPAHCTALGKTLLAFLDDYDFEQLYGSNGNIISITPQSISSLEDLKKELKKVKEQGYALDREESMIGINCIGVPIFNKDREAIAAISITGPASRFTLDKMENTKEQLFNISKEISNSFYES